MHVSQVPNNEAGFVFKRVFTWRAMLLFVETNIRSLQQELLQNYFNFRPCQRCAGAGMHTPTKCQG
ncbi:MAG: hypothetical protein ACI9GW_000042 [Halieaceae bacterium]|jgi:hypothetical protein